MQCFYCKKNSKYIFCEEHNVKYGDCIIINKNVLFVGTISFFKTIFFKTIFFKLSGFKIIKWWLGTDALEMRMTPPGKSKFRRLLHVIKMYLLLPFISEHWVVNKCLKKDWSKLKYAKVIIHPSDKQHSCLQKQKHNGLIVGYYEPNRSKFSIWKYGLDIIDQLKIHYQNSDIMFWKLNKEISDYEFSKIDCYIRPSRHDGTPRINLRCKIEKIPYKYSSNFKPTFESFRNWINAQYKLKTKRKF